MLKSMKALVLLGFVSFTITGCILNPNKKDISLEMEVDDFLDQPKYGVALIKLDKVVVSEPKYEVLRKQVLDEAKDYETRKISESRRLVKQNQLYRAIKILEKALENFHQSTALEEELALLAGKREAAILQKRDKLAPFYAHYLIEALDAYQQIARWELGSEKLSEKYRDIHREAEDLAKYLIERGEVKQTQEDTKTAAEYFKMALKLSDTESIKTAYKKLSTQNKIIDVKLKIKQTQSRLEQVQQLNEQIVLFRRNIKQKDFVRAKKRLESIRNFPINNSLKKELEMLYQLTLDKEIENYYQKGTRHYSAEQYQFALESWEKTLKLDPKHEMARKNVERVLRILKKINQLKKK